MPRFTSPSRPVLCPSAVTRLLCFGEFSLDPEVGVLRRGEVPVAVRRKVWDALALLLERPGALISLDELRERVWRGVLVGEGSVATLIYELRRTLDDSAASPRYIETIPARGLRFVAEVEERTGEGEARPFVGRDPELRTLATVWGRVVTGERHLVLVAGEPGIGKSYLIAQWVDRLLDASDPPRVLMGRCSEREGGAEAFLPIFDILDAWRLSEGEARDSSLAALLRTHAPCWARQLPWAGRRRVPSALAAAEARPERMRREISSVFDAAAAQRPLVLILDDLQWGDSSTIELIHHLITRPAKVPILVIATYRPADAAAAGHPVRQLRSVPPERITTLELAPLAQAEVRLCLEQIFANSPDVVARLLEQTMRRSGGHPLMVVALSQTAIDRQLVTRSAGGWRLGPGGDPEQEVAPAAVTTLLEQQLGRLTPRDHELLEVAAVAGEELDAAAVAGGLGMDVEEVDTELRRLTLQAALVREVGVSLWPDGTAAGRFRFRHSLYREILYSGLPVARRARLHRHIGAAIERGFAAAPESVVPLLAIHFEAGGDHPRAAELLERAGLHMIARAALGEAREYFRRASERVALLPQHADRDVREMRVRTGWGLAAALTEGLESAAIAANYEIVDRLRHRVSDPEALFPTLRVFWVFELLRFRYSAMAALSEQLREVAEARDDDAYRSLAASMMGTSHCFRGNLRQAHRQYEQSIALCDDGSRLPLPQSWLADPRVETRCLLAWTLWLEGEFERSRTVLAEARRLASAGGHEGTRGLVLWFCSSLAQLDGDIAGTRAAADALTALAAESDLPAWLQIAAIVRALADLTEGDSAALEQGLAALTQGDHGPSVVIARAYLLGQLALVYGKRGEPQQGLALVDLALARIAENQARVSEADLRRIRGLLLAMAGDLVGADRALLEAIEVAQGQGARTFELRAATERVRLLEGAHSRKLAAARAGLAKLCSSFPEDADAADLRAARSAVASRH